MAGTPRPASSSTSAAAPHAGHDAHGHGNSVAAWSAVGLIMLGSLVMSIAMIWISIPVFAVGAVIALLGPVAGKVLSRMGYGSPQGPGS